MDGPAAEGAGTLSGWLRPEIESLDRELTEIDLLVRQVREEAERHESRRQKGDERVTSLEADPRATPDELKESRRQLLALTRKQMLFETQRDVLEGKQQSLQRYRDALARVLTELGQGVPVGPAGGASGSAGAGGGAGGPAAGADATASSSAGAPLALGPGPTAGAGSRSGSRPDAAVLRAQEELRRDIARQMHDGPAQSLANIALQAEIVERLVLRGDSRASDELESLRHMVQSTLAATKEFIFDVRPMVLDDLGLVPTLRRAARDRGERASLVIDFDSTGPDRRLPSELESGVFRITDDLIAGYLAQRPDRIAVRLDWSPQELVTTVRGTWAVSAASVGRGPSRAGEELPPALAAMIEQKDHDERQAIIDAHSIQAERLAEIRRLADALGGTLTVLDDGDAIEVAVAVG